MRRWTMLQYLSWWLESIKDDVRPGTYNRYASAIRLHILSQVGNIRVTDMSELDVERVQKSCQKRGLSNASNNLVRTILNGAMKKARQYRLIRENVVANVSPKREEKPKDNWWSPIQVQRFLEIADSDELAPLWRVGVLTGIRRGELLALTWDDVDLIDGVLTINKSYSRQENGFAVGPTKSDSSGRLIRLSSSVVESLISHKARQLEARAQVGEDYQDKGLVFANALGGYISPSTLLYRYKKLIGRAGLPHVRFHDLRHSNGSMMVAAKTHPKLIQSRLGHKSLRTTERYMHSDINMQNEVAVDLDRVAGQATPLSRTKRVKRRRIL